MDPRIRAAGLGRLGGRRGRGLEGAGPGRGAGLGRGAPRAGESQVGGFQRSRWRPHRCQTRMPAGSVRFQLHFSPAQRQLGPAGAGDAAALCPRTLVSPPRAPPEKAKCSQVQRVSRAVPERTPPDPPLESLDLRALAEPFQSLFLERSAPGARGSGIHGGKGGDQDTNDGQTDLARGLLLSPPSGSCCICPKRRRAELRGSSETFPVAPGGSGQGAARFAEAR